MLIFGFVFYVSKQGSGKVLEKKIDRIYGDFLRVTSLENFIQTCLEQSTKDAIILAGLQGGKIYDTQATGGFRIQNIDEIIPLDIKDGDVVVASYNVSYGIRAPDPDQTTPEIESNYPDNRPLDPSPAETFSDLSYDSLFARKEPNVLNPYSLTALCNFDGPNYYAIRNASYSCETLSTKNESLQQYLRLYIISRTKACVNILQFSGQSQLSVQEGEVDGFIAMGDDDVFVSLRYPLLLSLKNSPPFTRFLDFSYRPKIRLKKLHEWASHTIGFYGPSGKLPKADAHNIFFNMTKDSPLDINGIAPDDPHDCMSDSGVLNQPCKLPGFEAARIYDPLDDALTNPLANYCLKPFPDPPEGCVRRSELYRYSDVVNFTDTLTVLDGRPLSLLFAVENRPPVLGHVGDNTVPTGQDFFLRFSGRDPDDINVAYELKGQNCNTPDDTLKPNKASNGEVIYESNGDIVYYTENGGIAADHEFCMVIKDNAGLTDQQKFWVRVTSP